MADESNGDKKQSGFAKRVAARATRIRHPPENSEQGRFWAASLNPSPANIRAARAGAASAEISASRV